MKAVIGCTLEKAKSVNIDKGLWLELEELAAENLTEGITWGEKETLIMWEYYPLVTSTSVVKMLQKVSPEKSWHHAQIRSKAYRMGLLKKGSKE